MGFHEKGVMPTCGELYITTGDTGFVGVQLETGFIPLPNSDAKPLRERKSLMISDRRCESCGKPLIQKRWKGQLEAPSHFAKRRFCQLKCWHNMDGDSKAAIAQALRFHFDIPPDAIKHLLGWDKARLYAALQCGDDQTTRPWWQRKNKQQAIEAAQKLLEAHHAHL